MARRESYFGLLCRVMAAAQLKVMVGMVGRIWFRHSRCIVLLEQGAGGAKIGGFSLEKLLTLASFCCPGKESGDG